MPPEFTIEEFDAFVENLDEQLLESADDVFNELYDDIQAVNSPYGIEADNSFGFRLLEYARQRVSALRETWIFEVPFVGGYTRSKEPPGRSDGI